MSEPSSLVETNGLCRCGHTGKAHPLMGAGHPCTNHGCDCRAFVKVPLPTIINDRCKCSHDRFRHNWGSEADGACSKPDCECALYAPVTVETVELPEPDDLDSIRRSVQKAADFDAAGWIRRLAAQAATQQETFPASDEISVEAYAEAVSEAVGRLKAGTEAEPKHPTGETHEDCPTCWEASEAECMCCTPALADEPCPPPQPERRPPLTVQYSVAGGHPYEVSIPGDASVTAEDGVLIIKHPSAQILAITRVAPMEG